MPGKNGKWCVTFCPRNLISIQYLILPLARNSFAPLNMCALGNLGDVIQPMALEHLLASVAPDVCFWYAHPWDEDLVKGNRVGEFFGADTSRLIHLTHDDNWQVRTYSTLHTRTHPCNLGTKLLALHN